MHYYYIKKKISLNSVVKGFIYERPASMINVHYQLCALTYCTLYPTSCSCTLLTESVWKE